AIGGCESNTTLCSQLSREELNQTDISICSCYEFGDPRSSCSSQTQECKLASVSELNDIPVGVCGCYEFGDPRIECSQSQDCNYESADLSNIPISLCPCNSDNDPRRGITCAVTRSGESGVYNLSTCRSTKTCIGNKIPIGCTPLCTLDSGQLIEFNQCFCNKDYYPVNCRCPIDSSQLTGIPSDRCSCRQTDDPRDENLCKFQLKKVELIVNTSNVNPLRFKFYGERFQQGQLSVLIVELGNKTEEEIKYEKDNNKQFEDKYNAKKSNQTYTRNNKQNQKTNEELQNSMFECLITSKFINPLDHNLPNIITNEEELTRDEDGNIIWPAEYEELIPFTQDANVESDQNATFSMNDISWLGSRKKWYGMLISADNETYYGANGNEGEAVRIDVVVEEGEQFANFIKIQPPDETKVIPDPENPSIIDPPVIEKHVTFPFWLKLLIIILASTIALIFIFWALNIRQQKKIERKAALTILRALLWNRDYHASRPAFELMRQQRNVVQELIESEKNYVSKMEDCIKYYLQPLQKQSKDGKIKVSQSQLKDIFINMEQILKFHKLFSNDLQSVAKNWTVHSRVGQMFCKQAPFMKISVEYFQKKEKASKLLRELLKSDPKFNQIVDDISQQDEVNHEPLEQFLNRPVKRISEYNLLLQKMNESMFDWQADTKHVQLASKMMEEIASFFNFCIHRKGNLEKVFDIEQQIISYNPIPLMFSLSEEATQIELAKKQGLNLDEYEIMKIRLQWQKYFHRIRLVRPSRCFVSDIEVFQVDSNSYQRRFLILLSDVLLICKKKKFQQKYELLNVLNVETLEFRMAGKMQDMEQLRNLKNEINSQIENQKELERKQQEEDEEEMKNINDTKLVLKMDGKQKQLYLMNAIEGRFLFLLFTPTNTYLFDAMNSESRRLFISKLEGYVKKQDENIQKKVEGDDQYEEIEYEEEEEIEQEIEQEELVPFTETSPIQDQNEKEIYKDKDDDNLDDTEIPPRNCVSPSLVNQFLPPIKPLLWARLLNDWQVNWKIQIEQDQPRPEEYIPLLKQDSGSKYYNIQQEPDKIQEKIDELKKGKKKKIKEGKEQQIHSDKQSSQQELNKQQSDLLTLPQFTKRTQSNDAADKNDKEKLAEQSNLLQGYSQKGRQQRMKSGYKVLGIAVDDAEKNSTPVAPQMLPRNHPFMLHGPPRKWYQKQINKMIYTKSQIADILATRELKSIFDTPWFQEYTEEFKKKNIRNIAKLTWPQIYEAQIPDHIIELPELTKEQKKSTLRFGYVDSDSDYADDSDDDEDEDDGFEEASM
ncbi:MAG: hypothetical protein EZS28_019840, partial [Streblomastix strix]